MDCQEVIEKTVESLRVGLRCLPDGRRVRIVTPYLYPDNDLVEVFVEELGQGRVRVTDLGETLRHLESHGVDVLGSAKRRFLLEQVAKRIHVDVRRGKLVAEGPLNQVGSLVLDVVMAAQGVADLIYTSKAYEPATFPKEVSIFLTEHNVPHESHAPMLGSSGTKYWTSLRIDGSREVEVLVEAMSPMQESGMTPVVNRVFRMWSDVNGSREKISLLNDVDYSWRERDINILQRVSLVHRWSAKEEFLRRVSTA